MRVLITGITGFAGRYLAQFLAKRNDVELHGLARNALEAVHGVRLHRVDLLEPGPLRMVLDVVQPDHIYHLAAYADAGSSFRDSRRVWDANLAATLNLYDACLGLEALPRILYVSTGAVYGEATQPITEQTALQPNSPYAASKAAADLVGFQYWASHRLPVIRVRAFNQTGPGQPTTFALGRFVEQLVRMECGKLDPVLRVGNLDAERDFTDVRDMVRAYSLLMQHGQPGEIYNAASGISQPMHWFLDRVLEQTHVPIRVQTDPELLRPVETRHLRVDIQKLRKSTGWMPEISIQTSLADLVAEARRASSHA